PTLQYNSCFAVVALPGMGQLCCDAQFHNLAYESRFHSPMVAGLRLKPEPGTEAQMLEEWSRMMGKKRILFPILLLLFGGMALPAQTQTADPAAGEAYAEKVCAMSQ